MREVRKKWACLFLLSYARCFYVIAVPSRSRVCLSACLVCFYLSNYSSSMFSRMFCLFALPLLMWFLSNNFCYLNTFLMHSPVFASFAHILLRNHCITKYLHTIFRYVILVCLCSGWRQVYINYVLISIFIIYRCHRIWQDMIGIKLFHLQE